MTPEQVQHEPEVWEALEVARELIRAGVPIFRGTPDPDKASGYALPSGWQNTVPDEAVVDAWRPGDALCLVCGVVVDGLDNDPRNGGDASASALRSAGLWPKSYGTASTPSGGTHDLIARLHVAKASPAAGIDVQAGADDGQGRGFLFIAPTVRTSRVTGLPAAYRWTVTPDVGDTAGDDSGADLAALIGQTARRPHPMPAGSEPGDPFSLPADSATVETAARTCRDVVARFRGMRTPEDHGFNAALNNTAMTLGHHVPAFLSYTQAQTWLYEAATHNGSVSVQGRSGVLGTIRSGLFAGMRSPRTNRDEPSDASEGSADAPPAGTRSDAVVDGDVGDVSSWTPEDLGPMLDGTVEPVVPELFPREDGEHLLYRGLVHSFHGESESGKSMIAQYECARVVMAGGRALYVDFESDAATVVPRILAMGATPDQVKAGFVYVRPDARPTSSRADEVAYGALLADALDVAVIDGVTESMGIFGVEKTTDNDQVTKWMRYFPRAVARRTGAAVVLIDHVTKSPDTRGRFAIGAQAKMAGLDGAGYIIETRKPLGRGMRGAISIRVGKDRPGAVRPISGEYDAHDRTQETAYVIVDSTTPGRIRIEVRAPVREAPKDGPLMMAVSEFIEKCETPPTQAQIVAGVAGRSQDIRFAANALAVGEYIEIKVGARNASYHHFVKRFEVLQDVED